MLHIALITAMSISFGSNVLIQSSDGSRSNVTEEDCRKFRDTLSSGQKLSDIDRIRFSNCVQQSKRDGVFGAPPAAVIK